MYRFSRRSFDRLKGVRPELIAVATRALALSELDFTVLEGLRTIERQRELVASGASQTLRSRHITGHAIDLAPLVGGEIRWDWALYLVLAPAMKQAASDLGIEVTWGGTWSKLSDLPNDLSQSDLHKSFPDGPHFEIDPLKYQ